MTGVADNTADVRDAARSFCTNVLKPGAAERDRTGVYPEEVLTALTEVGYLGITFPSEYGGAALSAREYVAVIEEIGAADATARSFISVSVGLVGGALMTHGTPDQKDVWLPRLAGGSLGAFALTEPDAGSSPSELRARAVHTSEGWRLSGTKTFITSGSVCVFALVFARAVVDGHDAGITCFLVARDTPGYTATPIHGKLGLRACDTAELSFDEVLLPEESVVGVVGKGMGIALGALEGGRISVAAGAVGVAREALELALDYAANRHQFGKSLAGFQLIQALLAESYVDVEAARRLVERAADLKDAGEDYGLASSVAKLFATEAAKRCADRALQVHGGYGYVDDYPVQRLYRDARVLTLYEGTSEIQRLLIGKHLTGVSAFT